MGTRSTIIVESKGKKKICQYAQWDGYPTFTGQKIANFLKTVDLEEFIEKVDALEEYTEDERDAIVQGNEQHILGIDRSWVEEHPELDRGTGPDILNIVNEGKAKKVYLDDYYTQEDNMVEYVYIINLDNRTVKVGKASFTFEEFTKDGLMRKIQEEEE